MSTTVNCVHLQEVIYSMALWADKFGLSLNISKCILFYIIIANLRIYNFIVFNYIIDKANIISSNIEVFDKKLCFHSHIENISFKDLKLLGFVKYCLH